MQFHIKYEIHYNIILYHVEIDVRRYIIGPNNSHPVAWNLGGKK